MKEVINPALIGTTTLLKAVKRSAPSVKRVVVTSSFAAILDEAHLEDPNHTFSESSWNPAELEDRHISKAMTYRISKKLAEKAAFDFVANEKPNFDVVTVCPPLVLGPVVHHLATLDSINTSNERVVKLTRGEWKDEIPTAHPISIWIDVRDLAEAHVRAMERPEAGGKRLFVTAGYFSHRELVDAVRKNFPELQDRLPDPSLPGGEMSPPDKIFKIDNEETNKVLGIKWRTVDECMVDLVKSLQAHGI
jgi:nucleoside-diphosphate-sugar epimerase